VSISKRGLLALGATLAASVFAAVAFALAQDITPIPLAATVTVTPNKAGTPRHPQGIRIRARAKIASADDRAPLMPQAVDAWLPKGWRYNGAGHPACTRATLTSHGPSGCPPRSVMGHGQLWHPNSGDGDSTFSYRDLTIINGGQSKMYFWVVIQNPARVQAAVTGTITELRSTRWSYRLHADIPSSLQVVASLPVTLDAFTTDIEGGDWIATTHCPHDHRWRYHLKMTYASGRVVDTGGSTACRG
jgi:hypothetical protein